MAQDDTDTRKTGKFMAFAAWIIGMILLTSFLGKWEQKQVNPNQQPASENTSDGAIKVILKQNRWGHYLTAGSINQQPVTFMLDTGATDVVIPQKLASRLKLYGHGRGQAQTANGVVTIRYATLPQLSIGGITLYNVPASINPAMDHDQEILLGMSALRQLEIRQQGKTLTLIQHL